MRESVRAVLREVFALLVPLLLVPLLLVPLLTMRIAQAQTPALDTGALRTPAIPTYRVDIAPTRYEASAGVAFVLKIVLSPSEVPAGSFVTVNVERLAGPDGGRVESLSGLPETTITCSTPGTYRLVVRVDFVSKGSCGGIEANTLLEREIEVVVR